jgi:hypothetical protein
LETQNRSTLKTGLPKLQKLNHLVQKKTTLIVLEAPKKDGFEIKKNFRIKRFTLFKIKTIRFLWLIINGSSSILSP